MNLYAFTLYARGFAKLTHEAREHLVQATLGKQHLGDSYGKASAQALLTLIANDHSLPQATRLEAQRAWEVIQWGKVVS